MGEFSKTPAPKTTDFFAIRKKQIRIYKINMWVNMQKQEHDNYSHHCRNDLFAQLINKVVDPTVHGGGHTNKNPEMCDIMSRAVMNVSL